MNVIINLKKKILLAQYELSKKKKKRFFFESTIDMINNLSNRKEIYLYFHHYYWNIAPKWLKEHREYFKMDFRGFGEDAFHALWYKLFSEYKPKNILEIGVFRGQTLSLFSLLSLKLNLSSNIYGISPFTNVGDSVSYYPSSIQYYDDVIKNFNNFNLPLPKLLKGYSNDKNIIESLENKNFDLIYIDGNHEYEAVKDDFFTYSRFLSTNGLIVLDDSSLFTNYVAPFYASAGHFGPSKVALEIPKEIFKEIISAGHLRVFKKIIC